MIYPIEFDPRIPSKKNSKQIRKNWKTGQNYLTSSDKYLAWEYENLILLNKVKRIYRCPIVNIEKVDIEFVRPDKRRFDLDNKASSLLDVLVEAGIIEDDSVNHIPELNLRLSDKREKTLVNIITK